MTQDTIQDRLRAARALIDQPEKWTQGALRRDVNGCPLGNNPEREIQARCAGGAIGDACQSVWPDLDEVSDHLRRSINCHGGDVHGITYWNDRPERTHAEVMLAFDRAIEDATP